MACGVNPVATSPHSDVLLGPMAANINANPTTIDQIEASVQKVTIVCFFILFLRVLFPLVRFLHFLGYQPNGTRYNLSAISTNRNSPVSSDDMRPSISGIVILINGMLLDLPCRSPCSLRILTLWPFPVSRIGLSRPWRLIMVPSTVPYCWPSTPRAMVYRTTGDSTTG